MSLRTYPAMNKKIANLLRGSGDPMHLYAAARIDELEEGNEILHDAILDHQTKIGKLERALNKACVAWGDWDCPRASGRVYWPECRKSEMFFEFADAVDFKKREGWKSQKNEYEEWEDVCPECQEADQ